MNKETTIAIPADPDDPEDFDVSVAGWERGLVGRRVRILRNKLGFSQEAFATDFGIPVESIIRYERGQEMPPAGILAYLAVIEAYPALVCQIIKGGLGAWKVPEVLPVNETAAE